MAVTAATTRTASTIPTTTMGTAREQACTAAAVVAVGIEACTAVWVVRAMDGSLLRERDLDSMPVDPWWTIKTWGQPESNTEARTRHNLAEVECTATNASPDLENMGESG